LMLCSTFAACEASHQVPEFGERVEVFIVGKDKVIPPSTARRTVLILGSERAQIARTSDAATVHDLQLALQHSPGFPSSATLSASGRRLRCSEPLPRVVSVRSPGPLGGGCGASKTTPSTDAPPPEAKPAPATTPATETNTRQQEATSSNITTASPPSKAPQIASSGGTDPAELEKLAFQERCNGDFDAALELYQKALDLQDSDDPEVDRTLANIATMHRHIGSLEDSIQALERALHLQNTREEPPTPIDTVHLKWQLASVLHSFGDRHRALELYTEASGLLRNEEQQEMLAALSHDLGQVCYELGAKIEAQTHFERCRTLIRSK